MKHAALIVLAMALLAGCGGQSSAPAAGGGGGGDDGKLTIAVIPKALTHQFWLTVRAGAEAAAKEHGAKVIWQGASKETDVDEQMEIVQDMINSRVDAIVLAACDADALVRKVQQVKQAGIPLISIDSGVNSDVPLSHVATDNMAGAAAAAKELARLIGEKGEVGLIPFVPGSDTSEKREAGFKEGIAAFPEVKLVSTQYSQSDVNKAMDVTQDMLRAYPNLAGIFAASEPTAVGTAQAVRAAGKAGELKLVAFDGSPEEIKALKDGIVQALVVQNPFRMGYDGLKAAVAAIEGKPVEKRIDTGVTVVTMDNFNEPEIQKLLFPLEHQ